MIQSTNDYTMFQKCKSNRELDPGNIKRIKSSILAKNLLHLRPILVSKNFEIIDGQHRLEAARLLEVPIFYQIHEESDFEDVILLNANQKRWVVQDYINFYTAANNENYIKLVNFSKKHNLAITFVLRLLQQDTGSVFKRFRAGKYKFPEDLTKVNETIFHLNEINKLLDEKFIGPKKFTHSVTFLRTLVSFLRSPKVHFQTFYQKMLLNMQRLRTCTRQSDYQHILISIYNFRNSDPIEEFNIL